MSCLTGFGVEENRAEGLQWMDKTAKDERRAFRLYQLAVKAKEEQARVPLACCHLYGRGVTEPRGKQTGRNTKRSKIAHACTILAQPPEAIAHGVQSQLIENMLFSKLGTPFA